MKLFLETLGWWGAALILAAYALVSFSVVPVQSVWYQALNGFGSVAIVIFSLYKRAFPSVVLNIVWAVIAIVSILKVLQ